MGCDIRLYVEMRTEGKWRWAREIDVLDNRDYGTFGFLANVRNYSHSPVIAEPRGLPEDISSELMTEREPLEYQYHSHSWLTLAELLAYDYDQVFWDRRITKQTGPNSWEGAALAKEGEGEHPCAARLPWPVLLSLPQPTCGARRPARGADRLLVLLSLPDAPATYAERATANGAVRGSPGR